MQTCTQVINTKLSCSCEQNVAQEPWKQLHRLLPHRLRGWACDKAPTAQLCISKRKLMGGLFSWVALNNVGCGRGGRTRRDSVRASLPRCCVSPRHSAARVWLPSRSPARRARGRGCHGAPWVPSAGWPPVAPLRHRLRETLVRAERLQARLIPVAQRTNPQSCGCRDAQSSSPGLLANSAPSRGGHLNPQFLGVPDGRRMICGPSLQTQRTGEGFPMLAAQLDSWNWSSGRFWDHQPVNRTFQLEGTSVSEPWVRTSQKVWNEITFIYNNNWLTYGHPSCTKQFQPSKEAVTAGILQLHPERYFRGGICILT